MSATLTRNTPRVAKRRSASRSNRSLVAVASRGIERTGRASVSGPASAGELLEGVEWEQRRGRDDRRLHVGHRVLERLEAGLRVLAVAGRRVQRIRVVLGDHLGAEQLEVLEDLVLLEALARQAE